MRAIRIAALILAAIVLGSGHYRLMGEDPVSAVLRIVFYAAMVFVVLVMIWRINGRS